ncbi:MAG TPA: hypothetical protein VFW38_07555 [Solirubrobacteraceae bacterium]|nr:hypothetical protein [Solirubrobacteraceae bacterium]
MEIVELVDQPVWRLAMPAVALRIGREVAVADDRAVERHGSVTIEGRKKVPLSMLNPKEKIPT